MIEGMKLTITAGEALAAHRRVKISGATVIYADAGDIGIGTNEYAVASADQAVIRLDNAGGTVEMVAAAAVTAGADIYPAADGKISMTPSGPRIGKALAAATADGDVIECLYSVTFLEWLGKTFEEINDNKTLDQQDAGKVFYVTADAKTITLAATAMQLGPVTIINGGADAGVAVTISPNANDQILGPDLTGTANKDYINTKTTALRGDLVELVPDAADGYTVTRQIGTWAEEA